MNREDIAAAIVDAAGGKLIGRVRFQKIVYLLDQLGLKSGFEFDYHNYGPYSRNLDNAMADAKAFDLIEEKFGHRASDGARYSVFELKKGYCADPEAFGGLGRERAKALVGKFSIQNVTVLELAATIDWLWREEKVSDWKQELSKRKSVKVQGGRLERAVALLTELGLSPPRSAAAR